MAIEYVWMCLYSLILCWCHGLVHSFPSGFLEFTTVLGTHWKFDFSPGNISATFALPVCIDKWDIVELPSDTYWLVTSGYLVFLLLTDIMKGLQCTKDHFYIKYPQERCFHSILKTFLSFYSPFLFINKIFELYWLLMWTFIDFLLINALPGTSF